MRVKKCNAGYYHYRNKFGNVVLTFYPIAQTARAAEKFYACASQAKAEELAKNIERQGVKK